LKTNTIMSLLLRKITPSLLRNNNTAKLLFSSSASATTSAFDNDADHHHHSMTKLFNPTEEHVALRQMVRSFAEREVRVLTPSAGFLFIDI
jgi:hypothetical protein